MTQPSEPNPVPTDPSELLEKARRRGTQIRRRRRALGTAGSAAVAVIAIALPLSLTSGGSRQHLVQVGTPATSILPATTANSPATVTTEGPASTLARPTSTIPQSSGTTVATRPTIIPTTGQTTSTTTVAGSKNPTVGDANNGQTISISLGSTLTVQLNADNWIIGPSSRPDVLAMQGAPSQQRAPCVPGGTCGTTTATFRAEQAGQAVVSASRSYCGEAIRCQPSTDAWSITVQVTS